MTDKKFLQETNFADEIEEIKPEGKDLGTEVVLTATLGPYKLTYEKKYHRNSYHRKRVQWNIYHTYRCNCNQSQCKNYSGKNYQE